MRQGIKKIRTIVVLAIALLVLAVPAQTFAQQVTQEGYSSSSVDPVDPGSGSAETASQEISGDSGGSLPFTGLDAVLIAVAGVGLVGLGFGLRYMTRPETA
jgi:hypothetical protein